MHVVLYNFQFTQPTISHFQLIVIICSINTACDDFPFSLSLFFVTVCTQFFCFFFQFRLQVVSQTIKTVIVYAILLDPNRISVNAPKAHPYQVSEQTIILIDEKIIGHLRSTWWLLMLFGADKRTDN